MSRSFTLLFALMLLANSAFAQSRRTVTAIDLASIRDIGGHHYGAMSVSRDGKYVAFQVQTPDFEKRDYVLTWHIAETEADGDVWLVGDGGEVILNPEMKVTPNGDRPPVKPIWSPDGQWIYYLRRMDNRKQIWRSRRNGSAQEQLTFNKRDVLSASYSPDTSPSFRFAKDGNALFFFVAADMLGGDQQLRDEADIGFLLDERFRPGIASTPVARTCIDTKNKKHEVSLLRACNPQLWVYDFHKKLERKATPEEIAAYHSLAVASPPAALAGRDIRLFLKSKHGNSWVSLENEHPNQFPGPAPPVRLFASINGKEFRCGAEPCENYRSKVEGVWFRPNSSEVIFLLADGANMSMTGLYAWTPGLSGVRTILLTEDMLAGCEILENRAICLREQWMHPRTIVSVSLSDGRIRTIYDPNPDFHDNEFGRIEKIVWEDKFGAVAHGHLAYPLNWQQNRRYPLVITTYRSRGFLRGGTGDEYPVHLLAANGFMVLSYDKPRSFERFAKMDAIQAEWEGLHERHSSLSAQQRVLEILNQRGLIDLNRTAITGLSDGADQVIFALIHSDSFTTGIASGVFDYRAHYYLSNKTWRSHWKARFGGPPDENDSGYWRALSLGRNVDRVDAPLLVNVSDNELIFSIENISHLHEAGHPIEVYVFPEEFHIKWQPQHRLAIYRRNVQWLKFWLMGEEVATPIDDGQYMRWRQMRHERCAQDDLIEPIYCNSMNIQTIK